MGEGLGLWIAVLCFPLLVSVYHCIFTWLLRALPNASHHFLLLSPSGFILMKALGILGESFSVWTT